MTEAQNTFELVVVGRITKAAGIHGEVQVQIMTDSPDRFAVGGLLLLDGIEHRIEQAGTANKGRINLKLEGIDNRNDAEKLRDGLLTVTPNMVRELPEGVYYHYQMIDMEVRTKEGEHLGRIADILVTGSNDVYVVRGHSEEVLIPALDDVVLDVDIDKSLMTVSLPEGLR